MAVYRQGYSRYDGALTSHLARLFVLPKYAWRRLMKQRLVTGILVAAMFWPLACAAFIYLANRAEFLQGLNTENVDILNVNSFFFIIFMNTQSSFAIVLAALAGPSLIAPDLANGALSLYFSRPLSRTEYVAARLVALVGLLSIVTWIPGMLLFFLQSGMAGWPWFAANWGIGTGIFSGFALWILVVGLVALASSAYVKWRIVAGALVLAFFFVTAGATLVTAEVLRVDWAHAFNPGLAMNQIWRWMLGAAPLENVPGAPGCLLALTLTVGMLLAVIERRLRPVHVVS